MIIDISVTYHLTIGIVDVTNAFQNTIKDSSKKGMIELIPHHLYWFKFRLPTTCTENEPDGCYVIESTTRYKELNLLASSGIKYSTWYSTP